MLQVPPWELLGFDYSNMKGDELPICWREWAFEFVAAKAAAQREQTNRMYQPT